MQKEEGSALAVPLTACGIASAHPCNTNMVFVETKQEARNWLTSGRAKAVLALDSDVAGIFKETQFLQVC